MKLLDIIVPEAIVTDLAARERDDAINELIDALVTAGVVAPDLRDEFVQEVITRENRGSTGIGHGVAVPHVKHAAMSQLAVAVAISEDGVEFNSLDRQPVHAIFMLLSPEDKPREHLNAMHALFGSLGQETFRRFLRQARSREDVMTLLEEADEEAAAR